MTKEIDKKLQSANHDDPSNWKWGLFYYNKADKRIFPPKRIQSMGWTVNFANPYSILVLLTIILIIIAVPYMLKKGSY